MNSGTSNEKQQNEDVRTKKTAFFDEKKALLDYRYRKYYK